MLVGFGCILSRYVAILAIGSRFTNIRISLKSEPLLDSAGLSRFCESRRAAVLKLLWTLPHQSIPPSFQGEIHKEVHITLYKVKY